MQSRATGLTGASCHPVSTRERYGREREVDKERRANKQYNELASVGGKEDAREVCTKRSSVLTDKSTINTDPLTHHPHHCSPHIETATSPPITIKLHVDDDSQLA